jgi:hypothetical protein
VRTTFFNVGENNV